MAFFTRQRAIGSALILSLLLITLALVPWLIQDRLWADGTQRSKEWAFWLQTITGNWSPDHPPVSRWWFAFSAMAAFLLNNGAVFVLGGILWQFAHVRRREMKIRQAFSARDQMNKQALYKNLADDERTIKIIDDSFREGVENWKRHLVAVFGESDASRLLDILEKNV